MFLLTHLSLPMLCNILLSLSGLFAVRSSKKRTRLRWLKATLWSYLLLSVLFFLRTSVYGDVSFVIYLAEYIAILLLAFVMCEFGFSLAVGAGLKRPGYFRPVIAVGAALYIAGVSRAVLLDSHIYSTPYAVVFILPFAMFAGNVVFLGNALQKLSGLPIYNIVRLYRNKHTLSYDAAAILGLFASLCCCLLLFILVMVVRESVIARAYMNIAFSVATTTVVCSIVLTYLYFIEQRLEISTKIVGGLIVLLLSSSALLFALLYDQNSTFIPQHKRLLETQSIQFTPSTSSGYQAQLVTPSWQNVQPAKLDMGGESSVLIDLPFGFDYYGKATTALQLHAGGYALPRGPEDGIAASFPTPNMTNGCFGSEPSIIPFCHNPAEYNIFLHMDASQITATWQPKEVENQFSASHHQMQIKADGTITFNYKSLPDVASAIWFNSIGLSNGDERSQMPTLLQELPIIVASAPVWFDLTLEQRLMTGKMYWPPAFMLVLITALLWLALKPYLRRMLGEPIEEILEGLQEVNKGRLDIDIETHAKDEFGDLARGFTQMTESLKEARQRNDEQTELLEQELAERARRENEPEPDILSKDEIFVQKVYDVITANIGNFDFQINDLAEELAVSSRQLHRKIVALTAKTPAALVRTMRLEHARQLLAAKAANISEAAYQTGFRDVSYFSRLFYKQFGIAASDLIE